MDHTVNTLQTHHTCLTLSIEKTQKHRRRQVFASAESKIGASCERS